MSFKAFFRIFLISGPLFAASAVAANAGSLEIVAFGDSLMAGYELAAEEAYPAKLEKALQAEGFDVKITNASVSGDTTADGLARLDWSIPDGVDGVILELGANDALRGLSPQETRDNLEAMVMRLKERSIPVLLAGMAAPPNLGDDYGREFNPIFPEIAEKFAVALYPIFVESYILDETLKLKDGMHPNAAGVDAIVADSLAVATEFLNGISAN